MKKQIPILSISAAIFLLCTLSFIFFVDPFKANGYIIGLFYASLFCLSFNFFTLFFYSLRKGQEQMLHYQKMHIAMREAALISILLCGSLALSSQRLLYWWVELIFVLAIIFIEAFFLI